MENGSPESPWASALTWAWRSGSRLWCARAAAVGGSWFLRGGIAGRLVGLQGVEHRLQAGERDAQPGRPVVRLVADLVQRLLQGEEGQQAIGLGAVLWAARRVADGVEVALEERLLRGLAPRRGERQQLRDRIRLVLRDCEQGGPFGIFEGSEHSRHVLERRQLLAPLPQRARRLALEVDNIEIVLRHQY